MERLLVLEDAEEYRILIRHALASRYRLSFAGTLAEARRCIALEKYDLLLLDVSLPDGEGFSFCTELRSRHDGPDVPVIFLTLRSSLVDKVRGFSVGADDYIIKPFEALELLARVEAKLSRSRAAQDRSTHLEVGELRIHLDSQRVSVRDGELERTVLLTPLEFRILCHLVKHKGQVLSREQLLTAAWTDGTSVVDRAADKYIVGLRKKLGKHGKLIQTVQGSGYCLTTD